MFIRLEVGVRGGARDHTLHAVLCLCQLCAHTTGFFFLFQSFERCRCAFILQMPLNRFHPPPVPKKTKTKQKIKVVDAAVNTLTAFLASRSTMDSEETAALMSALAERALCCGRGPIEANADSAATMLLDGRLGQSAQRGAWLTLTARSGGAENEFFPPPAGADSAGARSKAAVAAAAPKAVGGCVRAMSSAMKGAGSGVAGSMAGGGECRREVRNTCVCVCVCV